MYIIDKQLSGMNGLDLCRKLKLSKETKDIPVIIVSAAPNLDIIAAEAGADDFLEKPFTKANLLNKLEEYCS